MRQMASHIMAGCSPFNAVRPGGRMRLRGYHAWSGGLRPSMRSAPEGGCDALVVNQLTLQLVSPGSREPIVEMSGSSQSVVTTQHKSSPNQLVA